MGQFRIPGALCQTAGAWDIDPGTLCLSASPLPGPLQGAKLQGEPLVAIVPLGATHVLADPDTYIGNATYANAKGNHECVVFAQQAGGAPLTSKWRAGTHVEPGKLIKRGTWVATFVDGKYQGHVGAFDAMGSDGTLTLIDQFNSRGSVAKTTYHVKAQPYKGRISNDPSKYYEVLW